MPNPLDILWNVLHIVMIFHNVNTKQWGKECYVGAVFDYNGTQSVTASGRTCQAWSAQAPHRHGMGIRPTNFKHDDDMPSNYCRVPNPGRKSSPWCYTTDPNTVWESCGIPTCECYVGASVDYNGTRSVTASGRTCQAWSAQAPHRHIIGIFPINFKHDDDMPSNYCRDTNPGREGSPWCYTTDSDTVWESCGIPTCESLEHRSCKVSSDCPLTNSICPLTSKVCKCDMEYKYDSDKNKCVKECDHYGDEFTLYDNVRITKQRNRQYVNTQTLSQCETLCLAKPVTILAISFHSNGECHCSIEAPGKQGLKVKYDKLTSWKLAVRQCGKLASTTAPTTAPTTSHTTVPTKTPTSTFTTAPTTGSKCYVGAGVDYNGTQSVTASGRTCQAWSAQAPHRHKLGIFPTNFKHDDDMPSNYCRDTNRYSRGSPWCYTTDPDFVWESCGIPTCVASTTAPTSTFTTTPTTGSNQEPHLRKNFESNANSGIPEELLTHSL